MLIEKCYGIVPLKKTETGYEVFLITHRIGHTSFPKGHAEENESYKESAERELFEETGLSVSEYLSENTFLESYKIQRNGRQILKTVIYFAAIVEGDVKLQEEEIESGAFYEIRDAFNKITYTPGKEVLKQVKSIVKID